MILTVWAWEGIPINGAKEIIGYLMMCVLNEGRRGIHRTIHGTYIGASCVYIIVLHFSISITSSHFYVI